MAIPRIDRLEHNKIINGNFDFWQRGTSFTSIAASTYSTDRFKYLKVGAMVHNIVRSTDVPDAKSNYSASIDMTTPDDSIAAGDYTIFEQKIEGYNIRDLIGRKFTVSFYVKAAITGTYCLSFLNNGADQGIVKEYTINAANTWEKKEILIDTMPTAGSWNYENGTGLYVRFVLAAGTSFHTSPDVWSSSASFATANQVNGVATGAGSFKLSQIMLNVGEKAGEFSIAGRNITDELQLCQRYYCLLTGGALGGIKNTHMNNYNGVLSLSDLFFPVEMRTAPTMSGSFTGGSGQGFASVTAMGCYIVATGVGGIFLNAGTGNADAEL